MSIFPSFRPSFGPDADAPHYRPEDGGLTKRELFAAMAMQGQITAVCMGEDPVSSDQLEELSSGWVFAADALIKALEAKGD